MSKRRKWDDPAHLAKLPPERRETIAYLKGKLRNRQPPAVTVDLAPPETPADMRADEGGTIERVANLVDRLQRHTKFRPPEDAT